MDPQAFWRWIISMISERGHTNPAGFTAGSVVCGLGFWTSHLAKRRLSWSSSYKTPVDFNKTSSFPIDFNWYLGDSGGEDL